MTSLYSTADRFLAAANRGRTALRTAVARSEGFRIRLSRGASTNPLRIGRLLRAHQLKVRERRLADEWLRTATGPFVPERYAWRAKELCAAKHRSTLATTLRRVDQRAHERRSYGIAMLNLVTVREHRPELRLLARRLEAEYEPVTPAGMLRVVELITDGGSPLYGLTKDRPLDTEIETIIELLKTRPA